jgi:adenylate cyclase
VGRIAEGRFRKVDIQLVALLAQNHPLCPNGLPSSIRHGLTEFNGSLHSDYLSHTTSVVAANMWSMIQLLGTTGASRMYEIEILTSV